MNLNDDIVINGGDLPLRVIIDGNQDAYWNMALDEALFISHIEGLSPSRPRRHIVGGEESRYCKPPRFR